jgi:hypothetical protein
MTSVIVSPNLTLIGDEFTLSLDHPIIGWSNAATSSNITATSSHSDHPALNMSNPATHLFWRASGDSPAPTYQYITITGYSDNFDYAAIARHNLGTLQIPISIGYMDTSSPPAFVQLISDTILADDGPALFRFTEQTLPNLTIRLQAGSLAAQIAVTYCGKLLVLPRKVYQGYAPISHARIAKVTNGRSEAGNFLGRIVTQEFVKDTMPLSLIDPTYFRDHIAAFLIDSKERPFFIAWRPQTYPLEVGYCHMTNDPQPVNEAPSGLIAMQLEMTGII